METTNNKANSKDTCRYAAAKGFGYHASAFDRATDEQIVHFMYRLNQPAFNKMIRELGRGKTKLADYLKEEKDKNSGAFGRLAAISNAMTEDSGILFMYDFSDDSQESVYADLILASVCDSYEKETAPARLHLELKADV